MPQHHAVQLAGYEFTTAAIAKQLWVRISSSDRGQAIDWPIVNQWAPRVSIWSRDQFVLWHSTQTDFQNLAVRMAVARCEMHPANMDVCPCDAIIHTIKNPLGFGIMHEPIADLTLL
jgi:hypothetical protein